MLLIILALLPAKVNIELRVVTHLQESVDILESLMGRDSVRVHYILPYFVCLFVFVALRPMSTAMVIAGRSVHFTTLFPWQA